MTTSTHIMLIKLIGLLLALALSLSITAAETDIPLLSIKGADWTSEESAYIHALHRKGYLKIATKVSSSVYLPPENGSVGGFHYQVLKAFADLARVRIEIELVEWNDYFHKTGEDLEKVKSDPDYAYVPTLIENVDLYLDGITVLAWRKKLFDIVEIVPSRQMLVSRKDNLPATFADLNNRVCSMVKNTSMEQNLERIKSANHIEFSYVFTDDFNAMDRMVSEGKADFTVYDSDRAFVALKHYQNLTIAWPVSEPEMQGWAIHKHNKALQRVLEKYIEYAQKTGILDKYWKQSYGVTFSEYLKILHLNAR